MLRLSEKKFKNIYSGAPFIRVPIFVSIKENNFSGGLFVKVARLLNQTAFKLPIFLPQTLDFFLFAHFFVLQNIQEKCFFLVSSYTCLKLWYRFVGTLINHAKIIIFHTGLCLLQRTKPTHTHSPCSHVAAGKWNGKECSFL